MRKVIEMKRFFVIMLVVLSLFILASCNPFKEEVRTEKPVIYLYPTEETEVSVKLNLDGDLTCTYPAYNNGWSVTATPDGTLTDTNG